MLISVASTNAKQEGVRGAQSNPYHFDSKGQFGYHKFYKIFHLIYFYNFNKLISIPKYVLKLLDEW